MSNIINGTINGSFDYGACGIVPRIEVAIRKPKFRNNGFNCYSGMPPVRVDGLVDVLPAGGGHVMVFFADGQRFGTYASNNRGDGVYNFS